MDNSTDHFANDLSLPHIVAVTDEVLLETPDPNITTVVNRGIYAFTSFKEARAFAYRLNSETTDPVAFRFKRHNTEDETE